MTLFDSGDLLTFAGLVVTVLATTFGALTAFIVLRRSKYDDHKHRVELEMMRRSLEGQMYMLSEKLVATEPRWKDVNHLLIASQNHQPDMGNGVAAMSPFLQTSGLTGDDMIVVSNFVFVLTPFHPRYDKQFQVISEACRELGMVAMRGDEEFRAGDIFPHILKQITRARLIVANIDGRNPNVFYELGLAHALGKTTLLVAPTPEDVPFDLRTKRLVLYTSLESLAENLKTEIARALVGEVQPPLYPRAS